MTTTTPKDLYNKYVQGDKITDNQLKEGIPFWKDLADRLHKTGPVFKLCANEAGRIYRGLSDFAHARGLDIEQPVSIFDISWKNTLNWEQLRNNQTYHTLDQFSGLAKQLGYQHFAWSGRVYFSETGQFTGVFSDEL